MRKYYAFTQKRFKLWPLKIATDTLRRMNWCLLLSDKRRAVFVGQNLAQIVTPTSWNERTCDWFARSLAHTITQKNQVFRFNNSIFVVLSVQSIRMKCKKSNEGNTANREEKGFHHMRAFFFCKMLKIYILRIFARNKIHFIECVFVSVEFWHRLYSMIMYLQFSLSLSLKVNLHMHIQRIGITKFD